MTAVAITLGLAVLALVSLAGWLTYGRIADVRALAAKNEDIVAANAVSEQLRFELKHTKAALAAAQRARDIFEEAAADVDPTAGLDPGDVDGRLLQAAEATRADRDVPAEPGRAVPPPAAASGSDAAGVRPLDAPRDALLDPDEVLR